MSGLNFLFGIGLFLLGMQQLERGIRTLSGARLRRHLRAGTDTTFGSVMAGVVTTGVLQSSSMVSLLVLAFASAGVLPLVNAVGVILGANLGSTFTGWIVATLGFKLDLEALALPLLGAAAYPLVVSQRDSRLEAVAVTTFGFGLLQYGLGEMKSSIEGIVATWDVAVLQGRSAFVYLLAGIVLAALVRSSAAVVMMALAAMDSQVLTLTEAAALAIGADLGTTSTTVLGSLTGDLIKRKLAFAHVFFNGVVDVAAFFLLLPVLPQLLTLLRISDPLYGLVAFHSLMNLVGLMVFVPLLHRYTAWIEKVFARVEPPRQSPLQRVPVRVVDAALLAVRETVTAMSVAALANALRLFNLNPERRSGSPGVETGREEGGRLDFAEWYEDLKRQEGELLRYALRIQSQPLEPAQALALERDLAVARGVIYGNKAMKDVAMDLKALQQADSEAARQLYAEHRAFHKQLYEALLDLVLKDHPRDWIREELARWQTVNDQHHGQVDRWVHQHAAVTTEWDGTTLSVQLNVNRELRHAAKQLIRTLDHLLVAPAETLAPMEADPTGPS